MRYGPQIEEVPVVENQTELDKGQSRHFDIAQYERV
jgi:hypothetical protein